MKDDGARQQMCAIVGRRGFLVIRASVIFGAVIDPFRWRRGVEAHAAGRNETFPMRHVSHGDEDQLLAIMRSCVSDADSFHGRCSPLEWTREWADWVVDKRQRSIVVTMDEQIVGYFEMPTGGAELCGEETLDHYRSAFWCGAAGIRVDLLGENQSAEVFRQLLIQAFLEAMGRGYRFVRAAAPWDRHPFLSRSFREYHGLTVEPFVDENGTTKFLLEWRLEDAIEALRSEATQS